MSDYTYVMAYFAFASFSVARSAFDQLMEGQLSNWKVGLPNTFSSQIS